MPCGVTVSERLAEQLRVAGRGDVGDEQLAHAPVPLRLPDGLGALHEEPPRLVAPRAAEQLAGCDDACGTLRAGRFDLGGQAADSFAGRFALATSTSAANAASSVTAMSASTLRSTSTPAALRPWTKRL